jgi:hypothetical protein
MIIGGSGDEQATGVSITGSSMAVVGNTDSKDLPTNLSTSAPFSGAADLAAEFCRRCDRRLCIVGRISKQLPIVLRDPAISLVFRHVGGTTGSQRSLLTAAPPAPPLLPRMLTKPLTVCASRWPSNGQVSYKRTQRS